MGRSKDLVSEELHCMLPAQSSVPEFGKYYERPEIPSGSTSNSSLDNALWNEDFSHRPTWCDAGLAYLQIKKGKARGNKCAICLRALLQRFLFRLGCFIQRHFHCVLLVGLIILIVCSAGLSNASVETNIEKLWVEKGGRLDKERDFIRNVFSWQTGASGGDDGGLTGGNSAQYLVLIQTPLEKGLNILNDDDLLLHAQVLKDVAQLTVDIFGEKWKLSDLCFKPPAPKLEASHWGSIDTLLDRIIPCITITPLDCFWEGSNSLGPYPPMEIPDEVSFFIPSLSGRLTWKNLDPMQVIHDSAAVIDDMEGIKNLFLRAGIDHGYLDRPCIDPLNPECPTRSPNHLDICQVVEKYLSSTNRLPASATSIRRERAISNNGNVTTVPDWNASAAFNDYDSTNTTLSSASQLNNDSTLQQLAKSGDRSTIVKQPLSAALCKQYAPEVRRLAKSDKTFLARLGFTETSVNYGQQLTGGCKGFAQKFMQWPEDLIVGGVERQSGQIIKAEALQTVLMISSPSDVYHRFKEHSGPKANLDVDRWTVEAADDVLKKWQRKYTDFIYNYANNSDQGERRLHPLAGTSVNDMLAEFSRFNPTVIIVGYVLMIVYAAASLCSCAERGVRSSVGLAIAGCLMVTLASVAGLGLSMWIGITFNAATTQIVPFLTLGLGVDDMFLLVHNYKEIVKYVHRDEIGFLMKETGLSALLTSVNNIVAFLAGSVLPVPALRDFCLQVAILLFFNAVTILTLYPAIMTIDLDRRKRKMVDIFCCIRIKNDKIQPKSSSTNIGSMDSTTREFENGDVDRGHSNNNSTENVHARSTTPIMGNGSSTGRLMNGKHHSKSLNASRTNSLRHKCAIQHWTLHRFVKNFYIPLLSNNRFKAFVLIFHSVLCGFGIVGFTRVELGLELTDVIPKGTAPYAFLAAREAYFSFYPFNTVIKGPTDYPRHQRFIHDFRKEIASISYVVKNNENQLAEESWLSMMAKWLSTLQSKLDEDMHNGHINLSGVVRKESASSEGKLAYKLLCNRGEELDCTRVGTTKLVDKDGLIEPDGFYNYITAWYYSDAMTYYISQANFHPIPPKWQNTEQMSRDEDLRIPPTDSIIYSQIPFFATDLVDTPATVDMIRQVRDVCDRYEEKGLPVFPEGIPFTFWEQYLHLWRHLMIALCIISGAVMLIVTILLMNPWIAAIIVLVLALMVVELAGFMGIVGLKLNPVSSVTLITAVGIGVEFTVHVSLSFLTALGTRNERMKHTLDHMFIPVLHGGLSTLLGVIMLAFSEFEFVVRYFFMVMSALIVLGLLNGLLLLPVLLSLIGPKSEVIPTDGSNTLSPPTPPPRRPPVVPQQPVVINNATTQTPTFRRRGTNIIFAPQSTSLSTIAEEHTPPSSVTPPATMTTNSSARDGPLDVTDPDHPMITVAPMKVMVHGASKLDSPMTLTAKAKLHVQVMPLDRNNRRSSIAACDAPPPYSTNGQMHANNAENQLNDDQRRRNRSTGSTPNFRL